MLYFTSDLHFGHSKVLEHRKIFSSIEEMDEALIENWNSTVNRNDTVIITGDMFYRNQIPANVYLDRLKGRKVLVKGNHDSSWLKKMTEQDKTLYFEHIGDFYATKQNGMKLRFCHYPMVAWESSRYGSLLICGHIHGKRVGEEYDTFRKISNAFNAGVDVNGFAPVTLGQMIKNNIVFYEREYTKEQLAHLCEVVRGYGDEIPSI